MSFIKNDSAEWEGRIILLIGFYLIIVVIMWYAILSFLISWSADLIWEGLFILIAIGITVLPGLIIFKSIRSNSQ